MAVSDEEKNAERRISKKRARNKIPIGMSFNVYSQP